MGQKNVLGFVQAPVWHESILRRHIRFVRTVCIDNTPSRTPSMPSLGGLNRLTYSSIEQADHLKLRPIITR